MYRPTGRPVPEPGRMAGTSAGGRQPSEVKILFAQARALKTPPDGNLCIYSQFDCHGEKIVGYDYCIRHILSDKSAPFKPCGFSLDPQSGNTCIKPAPFYARGDSYCTEHAKSALSARQQLARKRKPVSNILLDSLANYKKLKVSDESSLLSPFKVREETETEGLGLLALESEGIQDEDDGMAVDGWIGDGESDCESVDSEGEDCLQHAGVYTGEEVMRSMKDKLVKLQKLYIDQFQRILHKMRESRRLYLKQLKAEKEAGLMNIFNQPRDISGELSEYERMKGMLHYYSPAGREALLALRHRERRTGLISGSKPTSNPPPCQHILTTTTRCSAPSVPMAKFCLKHILEEVGQVLYRPCGVVTPADGPCETPVASMFNQDTCVFHTKLLSPCTSPKRPEKKEKSVGKEKKSSKLRRGKSAKDAKEEKVEVKEEAAEAAVKAGDDNEEVGKNDTETAEQGIMKLSPIKEEISQISAEMDIDKNITAKADTADKTDKINPTESETENDDKNRITADQIDDKNQITAEQIEDKSRTGKDDEDHPELGSTSTGGISSVDKETNVTEK